MTQPIWEQHLDRALKRVQEAIAEGQARQSKAAEQWLKQADQFAQVAIDRREQRRVSRQVRRKLRHEERRAAKRNRASLPVGVVLGIEAAALIVLAVLYPHLWWLVFVSLGLGLGAARNISRAVERRQLEKADRKEDQREDEKESEPAKSEPKQAAQAPAAFPEIDARLVRVDALCEKLLAEIKAGPQILRDFVSRPVETVQALQATCHELARRERELRRVATAAEEKRIVAERVALSERMGRESDAVVRQQLGGALAALDDQLRQRQELATSAARLEAESTRILYTLESLSTQVLRVKTADAASRDLAGAGLRQSLEQLTREVDAVAEALEATHADLVSPVVPISSEDDPPSPGPKVRS